MPSSGPFQALINQGKVLIMIFESDSTIVGCVVLTRINIDESSGHTQDREIILSLDRCHFNSYGHEL